MGTSRLVRRAAASGILVLAGLTTGGCMESAISDDGGDFVPFVSGNAGAGITAEQKLRAEQITSVFENDTIELQYAYMENIGDGRGFTGGRAGFTSGTGDLVLVVERYVAISPESELARYLPRLRQLAAQRSASVAGLDGLPAAWARATDDPRFRAAQDEVVDQEYYEPALALWHEYGLTSALSVAALYDAIIQHGGGEDPDGLPAMMDRATRRAGGNPASGVNEKTWLASFLEVRRQTLGHATDPATRAAWAEGVDRVDPFQELLDAGNFDLHGPIMIDTVDHHVLIP